MYVLLIVLLLTGIRAQILSQNLCRCSCCLGQYCPLAIVGDLSVTNCTADACLAQCRCSYPLCSASYPYGVAVGQCLTPVNSYVCRCDCCNTGSPSCTPISIGYSTSNNCNPGACSIACYTQYPTQCGSGGNGQSLGTCISPVTTTTPMTTALPWLGNLCSCSYCQSGSICSSSVMVGITSASQCTSAACTQACQNRYTTLSCSTIYSNQINGICLSQISGRTKCKCNCCSGYGCTDYEFNTNETCAACNNRCQQYSPCTNTPTVTAICASNNAIASSNVSFPVIILLCTGVIRYYH